MGIPEPTTSSTGQPAGDTQSPLRPPTLPRCLLTALGVSILGSVLLGVVEFTISMFLFPEENFGEPWPLDLSLAGVGKFVTSHLLTWAPMMLAFALVYWAFTRRRPKATPEPMLLGFFVLISGLVVLPADLALARMFDTGKLIGTVVGVVYLAACAYVVGRLTRRWFGLTVLRRGLCGLSALATVAAIVLFVLFVRSPLMHPGTFRVARTAHKIPTHDKPNVLWVVLDTTRADHIANFGGSEKNTPFLNEWGDKSILFTRTVANGMWTMPTHASMFTGVPLRQHGFGHKTLKLDQEFKTVAEYLDEAGYATGFFSNNPLVSPGMEIAQGFDTKRVVYYYRRAMRFSLEYLFEASGMLPPVPWFDSDLGSAMTNELVARWLDAHTSDPTFVFINFMEDHLPCRAPRAYREMFLTDDQVRTSYDLAQHRYGNIVKLLNETANIEGYEFLTQDERDTIKGQYSAAVRYLDDRLRELLGLYEARSLLDNTLVVILADHGEYQDTHGMWSHHFLAYDDLTHVPLLLHEPGRSTSQTVETPVQQSDLFATVVRTALGPDAVEIPPFTFDLFDIAKRGGQERIGIIECDGPEKESYDRLQRKTDREARHRIARQICAVDGRYKLLRSDDGWRELFNLSEDPGELKNLIYERADVARRLEKYIDEWLAAVPEYVPKADAEPVHGDTRKLLKTLGYVADEAPEEDTDEPPKKP